MPEVFFTADTHFGHARIIHICQRGLPSDDGRRLFASIEEHDEHLVAMWNATVGPKDTVWHLGDFAAGPKEYQERLFGRLKGIKKLIAGNHDDRRQQQLRWAEKPREMASVKVGGKEVFLCHYAMRAWPGAYRPDCVHLYGHSHGSLPAYRKSLDVGVDCWDYRPVGLDAILARMAVSPPAPEAADGAL